MRTKEKPRGCGKFVKCKLKWDTDDRFVVNTMIQDTIPFYAQNVKQKGKRNDKTK